MAPYGGLCIIYLDVLCSQYLDWINQSQVALSEKLHSVTPNDEVEQVFCVYRGVVAFFNY